MSCPVRGRPVGDYGYGTLYKITAAGVATILHSFGDGSGSDGLTPSSGVTLGSDGNFYGTTSGYGHLGRNAYNGTIFQYTPAGVLTMLYRFSGDDG